MSSTNAIPCGTQAAAEPSLTVNGILSGARNSVDHPSPPTSSIRILSPRPEITEDRNTPAQLGDDTESPDSQRLIARVRELEAQVQNLAMHLASVAAVVRAEDGRITRSFRGTAGEIPRVHTFPNLRQGDAVEIAVFRRDTTQPEPGITANNPRPEVHEDSESSSQIREPEERENIEEFVSGTTPYAAVFPHTGTAEPQNCSICHETLSTRATLIPCDHEFDFDCILPWFETVWAQTPRTKLLVCPLCRQRVRFIRHEYIAGAEYKTMDIPSTFRSRRREQGHFRLGLAPIHEHDPGSVINGNDNPAELPHPTNLRPRYVPGRPEDLILRTSGADQLDFDALIMMGPNELEDFFSDLRHLSQERRDHVDNDHMTRLANTIIAFRSLGAKDFNLERVMRRPQRFAGYNPDDSLDTENINRMSRREIFDFINTLISFGEFERISGQDVDMLRRRVHAVRQDNNPRPQLRWQQPRARPETQHIIQGLAPRRLSSEPPSSEEEGP